MAITRRQASGDGERGSLSRHQGENYLGYREHLVPLKDIEFSFEGMIRARCNCFNGYFTIADQHTLDLLIAIGWS